MNTAKEIATWAKASIDALSDGRSCASVYREVAQLSGLSFSLVQQFHRGTKPNPTVETMDRMVEGIKAAKRLKAAA